MKKIKRSITIFFGALVSFVFSKSSAFAQLQPMYGVPPLYGVTGAPEPTPPVSSMGNFVDNYLTPLLIISAIPFVAMLGIVLFTKKQIPKNQSKKL